MAGNAPPGGDHRPVTVWRPRDQEHRIGSSARTDVFRGEAWKVARGERGVAAALTVPGVDSRACAFLIQLAHRAPERTKVARVVVDSGGTATERDVLAQRTRNLDWQREVVTFPAAPSHPIRLVVESTGEAALRIGNIALWRELSRPLWAISHMSNRPDLIEQDLDRGANAIECDVWTEDGSTEGSLTIHHGFVPPYPRRSVVTTPFDELLRALEKNLPRLALVVFDTPPPEVKGGGFRRYGVRLAEAIKPMLPAERCMVSIIGQEMVPVFDGLGDAGFAAGRDISGISTTAWDRDGKWIDSAEAFGATALGLGTDPHVPWDLLRTWFGPVAAAVNGRDARRRIAKVYYWTVGSRRAMRLLLDHCVDGMIVNDPRLLRAVLSEPPYDALYRLAVPSDSQFDVFGPPALI